MSVVKLLNPFGDDNRVLGIDCSTNSVAYALFEEGDLVNYGEIPFLGSNVYERMGYARKIMDQQGDIFEHVRYLAIEKTIKVRSVSVAIKMGYFAGIVMSKFISDGALVKEIAPLSWQRHIGNNPLTLKEKQDVRVANPSKKTSWYTSEHRKMRKQRTIDWVKQEFNVDAASDNISDAIGIAYYATQKS